MDVIKIKPNPVFDDGTIFVAKIIYRPQQLDFVGPPGLNARKHLVHRGRRLFHYLTRSRGTWWLRFMEERPLQQARAIDRAASVYLISHQQNPMPIRNQRLKRSPERQLKLRE